MDLLEIFRPITGPRIVVFVLNFRRYGCVSEYMNGTDGMPSEREGNVTGGDGSEARRRVPA
jgi:hypothetical protein